MKTVFLLAALVALTLGASVPIHHQHYETKPVDKAFVEIQKKILNLFYGVYQLEPTDEYFKIGTEYKIEEHVDHYTDKKAVEEFMLLYKTGFLPKYQLFSIFQEKHKEEAIALFKLFYFAKDFETFYKTACYARVHFNEGLFVYVYYIAVMQRPDTQQYLLPAPYEVYPELFMNWGLVNDIYRIKEQDGIFYPEHAKGYGVVHEDNKYIFYANYSDALTYPNQEERISYFTEDIGLNSFYFYYHTTVPFWWNTDRYGSLKERRGEIYFYFYQKILARYYMERLTNGLGEIPSFSWYAPLKTGYFPKIGSFNVPFAQRSNYYDLHNENNYEPIRFLDIFEKTFFQYLQKGHFKAYEHQYDFHDSKAMNFVGNYWQTNADLFGEDFTTGYQRSYEMTARHVLGGAPKPLNKYTFVPSALDFYQTSMRDPAFYQLYNKIFDYMVQYKQYLKPYTHEELHFNGVKINDVKVDKLETYFEMYDFDPICVVAFGKDEKYNMKDGFMVRQPRLNHKPFTMSIDVNSEVATDAVFKIYIGPKYDSYGYPLDIEHNWMNFYELDWFTHKLNPGMNKVERSSEEFFFFKEDSLPVSKIFELLDHGKVPSYMVENFDDMPSRLMLPKGTKGGFPFQFFVFVFPHGAADKKPASKIEFFDIMLNDKPFGFPLDRPAKEQYFKQPNMFFEDVYIYHEGEDHPYKYATPLYKPHKDL